MAIYTNFDDAWAAYSSVYDSMSTTYQTFFNHLVSLYSASSWTVLRTLTYQCFQDLSAILIQHIGNINTNSDYHTSPHYMTDYFAWSEAPPAEVTMDAILAAMVTATIEELTDFIGYEDAYRQAIWNRPFNVEYFAALARGWTQWP